ncbi:MAG: chorismate-binding protein [Bacteroidia bacterium]
MDKFQLDSSTAFALFRLPNSNEAKLIIQPKNIPLKRIPISEIDKHHGFVVSEFLSGGFCYLLEGNKNSINNLSKIIFNADLQELKENVNNSKEDYLIKVNHYINSFKENFKKAIFSRNKKANLPTGFSIINAFDFLCKKHPNALVYVHHSKEFGLWMGATPEVLIQQQSEVFTTMSLAGTQPFSENIIWTDKEREEQQLVTDYIEQILVSQNIFFSKSPTDIVKAGNVAHLKTLFTLQKGFDLGALIAQLHPTPAVCGLPKDEALELINKTENYKRSLYTGFIGEIGESINLYVNLRCMQLFKNKALIYVGGGITQHSNPEKEWAETELKSQTMMEVLDF